jgi:hypothetical protein
METAENYKRWVPESSSDFQLLRILAISKFDLYRTEKARIQNSVELDIEKLSRIGFSDFFPFPILVILQTSLFSSEILHSR